MKPMNSKKGVFVQMTEKVETEKPTFIIHRIRFTGPAKNVP